MDTLRLSTSGFIRRGALLALALVLMSCDSSAPPASRSDQGRTAGSDPTADRLLSGKAAYDEVCADCHESGRAGAPRTDDAEAWTTRSTLWQSVLVEHASDGYIDMPAMGGNASITDPEVQAATEYMMSLAYPDRVLPDD